MTAGLPSPQWPLVDKDGKPTQPWYSYLKSADDTWRVQVVNLTSLSTVSNPALDLIPNHGVTLMDSVPATTRFLADPVPGCRKVLVVTSTSTTGKVSLQSTTMTFKPGTGWKLAFPTSVADKVVELVGVTTGSYYIVSNPGGITVTT